MREIVEIILYVCTGGIILFWVIPLLLHIWGAMLTRGIMTMYYKLKNKHKDDQEEKK